MSIQIQKDATFNSDRETNQFNSKQIIQILQTVVIDYFSTHVTCGFLLAETMQETVSKNVKSIKGTISFIFWSDKGLKGESVISLFKLRVAWNYKNCSFNKFSEKGFEIIFFILKKLCLFSFTGRLHFAHLPLWKIRFFKGTVSVISADPSYKDDNVRFTTVSLSDQKCERYYRFSNSKSVFFFCELIYCFLKRRNVEVTITENPQMKINSLEKQNHWYLIHTSPEK